MAPDITVHDHGSVILLRAISPVGKAWIGEHVDRGEFQPFPAGTRLVEPRYIGAIIQGTTTAGIGVEVR
jgi:hypothetical protein